MIKGLLVLISVLGGITALSAWAVPILWRHGSSAAFNLGFVLIVLTVTAWVAAYQLLKPRRKP